MSEGDSRPVESKPGSAAPTRLRYLYIYSFLFESPNWKLNLLYGFLCALSAQVVPLLGIMVFLGYSFEVMESFIRHPDRPYPDFEPNKLGYYLQRSVAPFLVSLVFTLPALLLVAAVCGLEGIVLVAAVSTASKEAPLWIAGGLVLIFITSISVLTLAFAPVTPFYMRAGLAQDVGQGFKLAWSLDFLKRVWFELLMITIFNLVTMFPMMLLGSGCCGIGICLVQAIDFFATASSCCQLYNIYLARGGEPIPFKDPPAPTVPYIAT